MVTVMASCSFNWPALPSDIQIAVLNQLPFSDVRSYALTTRASYNLALPLLFNTISLPSYESLQDFLQRIPSTRLPLIRDLSISTLSRSIDYHAFDAFTRPESPDATLLLAHLLQGCTALNALSIAVCGSLDARVILPVFATLGRVSRLSLENLEQEEVKPFSERLAVALAFSLPQLAELSLTRITRSAHHAPELLCSNVPVVQSDNAEDDETSSLIPVQWKHVLGDELRLPQLLRLSKLKVLRIRDTHLGDPMWGAPIPIDVSISGKPGIDYENGMCQLEVLDLGACPHVCPATNEAHTARILARVPSSIMACALSASLPAPSSASSSRSSLPTETASVKPSSPGAAPLGASPSIPALPRLHTLHLTPHVPTHALHTTLAQPALAASPVRTLSCAFWKEDVVEGCHALEAFLKEWEAGMGKNITDGARDRAKTFAGGNRSELSKSRSSDSIGKTTKTTKTRLYPSLSTLAFSIDEEDTSGSVSPCSPFSSSSSSSGVSFSSFGSSFSTPTMVSSLSSMSSSFAASSVSEGTKGPLSISTTGAAPGVGTKPLSPRRLAAQRRRAEERRAATWRLATLARELGLDIVLKGIELGEVGLDESPLAQAARPILSTTADTAGSSNGATRARANSA